MMNERTVHHAAFTVERTYQASPARVFAAFSNPETKALWYSKADEFDFSVGGREFSRGGPPEGPIYTFDACFQEIVSNQRIVYTYTLDMGDTRISVSVTTVEFTPMDAGTRLIFTEQGTYLDGHDTPEQREHGTKAMLNILGDVLRNELG